MFFCEYGNIELKAFGDLYYNRLKKKVFLFWHKNLNIYLIVKVVAISFLQRACQSFSGYDNIHVWCGTITNFIFFALSLDNISFSCTVEGYDSPLFFLCSFLFMLSKEEEEITVLVSVCHSN